MDGRLHVRSATAVLAALLLAWPAWGATADPPLAKPADVDAAAKKAVFTHESVRGALCGDEDRLFRQSNVQGQAVFVIHVGVKGRADEVRLFWSSGTPRLDKALAVCLLQKEKFKPVVEDGKPAESWRMLTYVYKRN